MTQLEAAKQGRITPQLKVVAENEGIAEDELLKLVATGRTVIPANVHSDLERPCGIGKGLKTKVNANLGTSPDYPSTEEELKKLRAALDARADTVMDLGTEGDLTAMSRIRSKTQRRPENLLTTSPSCPMGSPPWTFISVARSSC